MLAARSFPEPVGYSRVKSDDVRFTSESGHCAGRKNSSARLPQLLRRAANLGHCLSFYKGCRIACTASSRRPLVQGENASVAEDRQTARLQRWRCCRSTEMCLLVVFLVLFLTHYAFDLTDLSDLLCNPKLSTPSDSRTGNVYAFHGLFSTTGHLSESVVRQPRRACL